MLSIIPKPKSVYDYGDKSSLCGKEAKSFIKRKNDGSLPDEGYRLSIDESGIVISSSGDKGYHYALETLKQLEAQSGDSLPCVIITDEPLFPYRGFHLDCARHFFTVDEIKRLIDAASMFKFN
ncbi:MAG: family 20 glycosylhydrolase, partial [Clostridiales bacterium]|nr:family 20 glycosylhydrolase [Clostridiales bacterium]